MSIFADETGARSSRPRRWLTAGGVVFVLGLLVAARGAIGTWGTGLPVEAQVAYVGPVPDRLTDQQFWSLSTQLSEPNGYFRSENLVSNEHTFQYVIPTLERRVHGGV